MLARSTGRVHAGLAPDTVVAYRHREELKAARRQSYRDGLSSAQLYRQYRDHGAPGRSPWQAPKTWGWLLVHLPDLLHSRATRGRWILVAATICGLVRGSIKYRVLCL